MKTIRIPSRKPHVEAGRRSGHGENYATQRRPKRFVWLIGPRLLLIAGLMGFSPRLLAQGSLVTSDGLRLTLGSTGSVSSLQLNGTEYASASMLSGFVYRELP